MVRLLQILRLFAHPESRATPGRRRLGAAVPTTFALSLLAIVAVLGGAVGASFGHPTAIVQSSADSTIAPDAASAVSSAAVPATTSQPESRAVVFATGVAQLTGLAISPLLVLVAIGWKDFVDLGGSNAATLPLHANPWFLVPCTIVLGIALVKRCSSPVMPLPLRKVLDAADYLEAKLAALVAAGVLLPTIASTMAAAAGSAAAPDPNVQTAGFLSAGVLAGLVFVGALAVYLSVWITFHVIDALIVLSPFAIVDAVLVALRASILGVLALALLIHPFVALVLALPIIVLSFLFAGWCIRLDLFALSVAIDLAFRRRAEDARPRAFLARGGLGAPIRTMGHAEPIPGGLRFSYHPLFLLPKRTLDIPVGAPELVHGLAWPTLTDARIARGVVAFPPRYRHASERIAASFGARVREGSLRGGLRRIREAFAALGALLTGESTARA